MHGGWRRESRSCIREHNPKKSRGWTVKRAWLLGALAILVVAFFLGSGPAWGQATTSIRGTVTDPSNAAIPNATVTLTNTDTNLQRTATTDQEASYVFSE